MPSSLLPPFITLLCPSTLHTSFMALLCLQLCPHPPSRCCTFNFAHTLHHISMSSTLPTSLITLLCLHLFPPLITLLCLLLYYILHGTNVSSTLPHPPSRCCAFNFAPHPSSHCCAFNFALTLHHTVVSHHQLGSPVTCVELWTHPSLHHSPRQSVLIVKSVVPSRTVVCNQR